jgi:putative RNA 2'-phosphotransferase
MPGDNIVRTSKFLSFVLRHKPEAIGLALDGDGWANIDTLIACAAKDGTTLDRALIAQVVETNDKKRFAISSDGRNIRAVQGHSTESVNLTHVEKEPPALLYHGTATRFLDSIMAKGLLAGSRHHVHLSPDTETAIKVGQRHGKPVVLLVDAAAMRAAGAKFFLSENGVWLTAHVPPEFLARLDQPAK